MLIGLLTAWSADVQFLSLPLGTIAGAAFICALRNLKLDRVFGDWDAVVRDLCLVLDVEQVLPKRSHLLRSRAKSRSVL